MGYRTLIVSEGPNAKNELYVYPEGTHDTTEHARLVSEMAEKGFLVNYDPSSTHEKLLESYGCKPEDTCHCASQAIAHERIRKGHEKVVIRAQDVGRVEEVLITEVAPASALQENQPLTPNELSPFTP